MGTHGSTAFLRRFLRARRFDPVKAQKQFADAETWRTKHNVDELFTTFPADEYEDSKRFYPRWTGRRDKVRASPSDCEAKISDISRTDFHYTFTA